MTKPPASQPTESVVKSVAPWLQKVAERVGRMCYGDQLSIPETHMVERGN